MFQATFVDDTHELEAQPAISQYVKELRKQRAAASRQIARLKGGLKVSFEGVDHTGTHFTLMSKMIKSYDRLLATLDC